MDTIKQKEVKSIKDYVESGDNSKITWFNNKTKEKDNNIIHCLNIEGD